MDQKEISALTDQELINVVKKSKSLSITNALIIGFLMGVVFYSIVKNTWGFFTLIPLYFIYKMVNDPKNKRVEKLKIELKMRNLNEKI